MYIANIALDLGTHKILDKFIMKNENENLDFASFNRKRSTTFEDNGRILY